jgi:hypothetical protein
MVVFCYTWFGDGIASNTGCPVSVRTNPLPMNKGKYYWQHRILLIQNSLILVGCISPIAVSRSVKLGLISCSASPQLHSLWPFGGRQQCHNIGVASSHVDNQKERSHVERDTGTSANVSVCGTGTHRIFWALWTGGLSKRRASIMWQK